MCIFLCSGWKVEPATNTFQRELPKASGRSMLDKEIKINTNGTIVLFPARAKQAGFEAVDELQIIHYPTHQRFILKTVS
jgi:hypothetical protein